MISHTQNPTTHTTQGTPGIKGTAVHRPHPLPHDRVLYLRGNADELHSLPLTLPEMHASAIAIVHRCAPPAARARRVSRDHSREAWSFLAAVMASTCRS